MEGTCQETIMLNGVELEVDFDYEIETSLYNIYSVTNVYGVDVTNSVKIRDVIEKLEELHYKYLREVRTRL